MNKINSRGMAAGKAKVRLVKKYKNEYQELYREECAKLGLSSRLTNQERITKLQAIINQLQNEG